MRKSKKNVQFIEIYIRNSKGSTLKIAKSLAWSPGEYLESSGLRTAPVFTYSLDQIK